MLVLTETLSHAIRTRRVSAVLIALGIIGGTSRAAGGFQAGGQQLERPVTFTAHIAPILFEHCASCHRPGEAAPFSLLTYDEVRRHATQIAEATRRRYMPPWKPEPGYGEFQGARRLSDDQIALIQRWVDEGATEGDRADLPAVPPPQSGWRLGLPDLVVSMPEPYVLSSGGADVFRTFVIPIPVASRRYVRALEFHPGNAVAVHHANLKIDATHSSRLLDAEDPKPGYEGAGGREARFPDGHFLGWTPGQSPRVASDGLAWRVDPGSDLVIELHMMPSGKPEPIQPRVGLYFTEQPPVKVPYMIRLGRQDIDIPAGDPAYVSTDSYVLPVDVDVLAVQPHAHRLARDIRGFARLPDGATKWLVYIREWDMNWQDVYRFREPLSLPRGTVLTMRYTYDNSAGNVRNQNNPPRRVTFGQTTSSEMGDLWIQVMPASAEERLALDRDFMPKMLRDDIAGVEKVLEMNPRDARVHADLAFCYLGAGRVADALNHLEEAIRLDPGSAARHGDLATLLLRQRRFADARRHLSEAVRLKPDFAEAYNNLGVVSHAEGNVSEAIQWYERALKIDPRNPEAEYNLGRAFASRGEAGAAIEHYRRALDLNADDPITHTGLASVLATEQDVDTAIVHYRRALQLNPDLPAALVDLAWILATSQRDDIRAPAEAVRLAERVAELTGGKSAVVLDTLAAAYASAGQIDRAIATAEAALAVASASKLLELSDRIRARLEEYNRRR
jgi:tetratricopeptide (TPR) repeat protein/mono/diheme cytochrome c family protein